MSETTPQKKAGEIPEEEAKRITNEAAYRSLATKVKRDSVTLDPSALKENIIQGESAANNSSK